MSTHNIPLSMSKRKSLEISLNKLMSAAMDFLLGTQIAVENEPSVFEPLNFYFTLLLYYYTQTVSL